MEALSHAEEFIKSGIILKTVRIDQRGMPEESMSFKNIDYDEVYNNDDWIESEAYELFTSRFLFAVFQKAGDETISIINSKTGEWAEEPAYFCNLLRSETASFWHLAPLLKPQRIK